MGQYSDPSPHWRNDYDGVTDTNLFRQIIQGPSNFWIDPFIGQLKFARVEGTGTGLVSRTPVDLAGPLMPRTGSPTISTTLTTTYAAGDFAASSEVLNGRYGGVYYLAEGWGNVDEFEELAADFAVYDPVGTTGNLPVGASCGSTVGLVFNARVSSPPSHQSRPIPHVSRICSQQHLYTPPADWTLRSHLLCCASP